MQNYRVRHPKPAIGPRSDEKIRSILKIYNQDIDAAFTSALDSCLPKDFLHIFRNKVCAWSQYDLEDYVRGLFISSGCVRPSVFCEHLTRIVESRMPEFDIVSLMAIESDLRGFYEEICKPDKNVIVLVPLSQNFDAELFTALATRFTAERRKVVFVFVSTFGIDPDSYLSLGIRSFATSIYSVKDLKAHLVQHLKCAPLTPVAINGHLGYFERYHRSCKILQVRLQMDVMKFVYLTLEEQVIRLLWKFKSSLKDSNASWEVAIRSYPLPCVGELLKQLDRDFKFLKYEEFNFIQGYIAPFLENDNTRLHEFIVRFSGSIPKNFSDVDLKQVHAVSTNFVDPSPFDYEDLSVKTGHSLLYVILKDLAEKSKSCRIDLNLAYDAYAAGFGTLDISEKLRKYNPKYHYQVILDSLVYRGIVELDQNNPNIATFIPRPSLSTVAKLVENRNMD